jgi:sugar phosphate isomerase/epimerase
VSAPAVAGGGLAFSTLGCPGVALAEVVGYAVTNGCAGLELRYAEGEPVHPGLSTTELAATGRRLADAGIVPLALASYIRVAAEGPVAGDALGDAVVSDLHRHLEAAQALGAGYIRVFPGGGGAGPAADARAARRLAAVADAAAAAGVGILLETHDSHRRATDAARVLRAATEAAATEAAGGRGVPLGAIWDVMHTWLAGETPAESAAALFPWLGYVQVKDVPAADDRTPVPPGEGVLPLADVLGELRRRDYQGWISLEYERAWHPEVPALPDVLPTFVSHLAELGW